MLKSNSRKAIENIRCYILRCFNPEGYEFDIQPEGENGEYTLGQFAYVREFIRQTVVDEKLYASVKVLTYDVFEDWCRGLPALLDTCYFYNRSAVDDLAAILEETEDEKSRYNENAAEVMLTKLIWRELITYRKGW